MYFRAALALVLSASTAAFAAQPWVTQSEYGRFHVVADPAGDTAAETFQRYWRETTGHSPTVSASARPERINVFIGAGALPEKCRDGLKLDTLGKDGVVIRTLTGAGESGLILAGQGGRGVLYSVYEFFDRYMGVRWLAPDVTHIPAAPPAALPSIDYRYAPPFSWRENDYHRAYIAQPGGIELRRAHKHPDSMQFICYDGHNLYKYVPPETYFSTHPEYFAEVDGKRVGAEGVKWQDITQMAPEDFAKAGQLCLSNPEVAEIIAEGVKNVLRAHPEYAFANVSQMDWGGMCECAQCRAIDEREDSPAGSLLTCVNRVADLVKPEFPDTPIQTFAYLHTQKPPKHLKPRDNVIVVFAPIGPDYSCPLGDKRSPVNLRALNDMKGWAKIAPVLQGWEYTPNFENPNGPHPNFHVIQPNIAQYARHGVRDLFCQGWATDFPGSSEFAWLRSYIVDKALWNPEEDGQVHMREFVNLYYGNAAPYILDYIALMREHVEQPDIVVQCFNNQDWVTYDVVVRAQELFAKAIAAAETPEIKTRVEEEYVAVQYAALVCPPVTRHESGKLVLVRPPSGTLEDYLAALKRFAAQGRAYEGYDPVKYIMKRCNGATPPRLQSSPIETIENTHGALWITPGLHGAIVRWTDKTSGAELFNAYREGGSFFGAFQDWGLASKPSDKEGPVAASYDLIARSDDSVTLRTTAQDGLVIERTVRLLPDANALDIAVRLYNPTGAPIVPRVKLHPEFSAGKTPPEIWREEAGVWRRVDDAPEGAEPVAGGPMDLASLQRWAAWLPDTKTAVTNETDPDHVAGLFWFYNLMPRKHHVNLEVIVEATPLQPGESRSIHTRYTAGKTHPKQMGGGA